MRARAAAGIAGALEVWPTDITRAGVREHSESLNTLLVMFFSNPSSGSLRWCRSRAALPANLDRLNALCTKLRAAGERVSRAEV